jgi:hypothetical protein
MDAKLRQLGARIQRGEENRLFQRNNLAEQLIDDAAAFDENYAEERPGFTGDVLDNQAAVLHAHLVKTVQFFVQRFGENSPALQGVDGFPKLLARGRRLAADEFARLRLNGYFHLRPKR